MTGEPEPAVIWMKTDLEITADMPEYKVEKDGNIHRLTISHVKPSMAALYNARAENTAGQTSCRSRLKVKGQLTNLLVDPTRFIPRHIFSRQTPCKLIFRQSGGIFR